MEIASRKEFKILMEAAFGSKITSRSAVWIPEHIDGNKKVKCTKFAKTRPINFGIAGKDLYWDWCNNVLTGTVRCFYSSDKDEWWGFTDPDDIVVWALKWAK